MVYIILVQSPLVLLLELQVDLGVSRCFVVPCRFILPLRCFLADVHPGAIIHSRGYIR